MSHYVVAAGGTGGHMVPASVVAHELIKRGHRVTLLTDARGLRFPGLFTGVTSRIIESAVLSLRTPLKSLRAIWRGRADAMKFLKAEHVAAVIGFGGYPSLPPLLAASALKIPTILHEQNAVFGRTNRFLAGRATRIATSFAGTRRLPAKYDAKTVLTGLPVRDAVRAIGEAPPSEGLINLLIIGGSQGASILSRVVPAAIAELPADLRARLLVIQQCREEDLAIVRARYTDLGVAAECASYFADLPARLAAASLVVSRSGASTMAELAAAGRPAILVPFAAAMDDHQTANAAEFVRAGAGPMLSEKDFTPANVAAAIVSLTATPDSLQKAAHAAKSVGRPDAGAAVATLAIQLGAAA
ncbi:undecaprenyldiphospho-muramoylpentapeptide beta-N-acetylglucosaminyltransferase [Sphingosinicellaceae bacterium]|nr:undecaprenyldiphospho-muramoylpentapeptide beta-N-acetylglucosaminyltransferase [Sphingosinicellaceae bacterium]